MEKKSILEKTNSWKPFIDEARSARHAKDYRRETVRKVFSIVDPNLSFWPGSIWKALLGTLIGPGFAKGRELLYYNPCLQFIHKNKKFFENAPLQAVSECNAFVNFLFSPEKASTVLLDEKIARKNLSAVEKALDDGRKARESFEKWFETHEKFIKAPSFQVENLPEKVSSPQEKPASLPIFSLSSPLDEETRNSILAILSSQALSFSQEPRPTPADKAIIRSIEEAVIEFKQRAQALKFSLSLPSVASFKDLLSPSMGPHKLQLNGEFLGHLFAQSEAGVYQTLLKEHIEEQLRPLVRIKTAAENRAARLHSFTQGKKQLIELLTPFTSKKEVSGKAEILINEVHRITISDSIFQEQTTENIEKFIRDAEQELALLSKKVEEEFHELFQALRVKTESSDRFIFTLCASLYEIVSAHTPYPDLLQTTTKVQQNLLHELALIRTSFLEGACTLAESKDRMVDCSFSPDIRLIRGEIASRAYRLFDLTKRVLHELHAVDLMLTLTFLAQRPNQKLLQERTWLYQFLEKLENPFLLFRDTFAPDSTNIVFRYWWEDFERFLRTIPRRRAEYAASIVPVIETLTRPILRTLDTIDTIESTKHRNRYVAFTKLIENKKGDSLLAEIEKYLLKEPLSLIEGFIPHLCSLPGNEQAPLIEQLLQLEERIAEITSLAADLRAIKTHEGERIDSILNAFLPLCCIQSFETPPAMRLKEAIRKAEQITSTVEETLLIELGFLSRKARMEQGYALTNMFPKVVLLLPSQIEKAITALKHLHLHQNPYISSLAHHLLTNSYQLQQSLAQIRFESEKIFDFVQELALVFLTIRLLTQAQDSENFANILLLLVAIPLLNEDIRSALTHHESTCAELLSHLEALYINPLDIITPKVIAAEPLAHKLEEYVHTASRLIALLNLKDSRENQLLDGIKKVLQFLPQIISVKKIPDLIYIPGCMDFFTKSTEL